MRKLMMVLVTVALSGCAGMSGTVEQSVDGDTQQSQGPYEAGKDYFAQKQYGLALAEFRKSLRQNPRAPRELNAVAAVYDQLLRFDLADRYYQLALGIDPNSVQTLNNLGYSHYRRSQEGYGVEYLATARAYLARASALAGDNPVVVANLDIVSAAIAGPGNNDADVALSVPGIQVAARDAYAAWIERTGPTSVLIVMRPDPAVVALTRSLGVLPQITAVSTKGHVKMAPDTGPSTPATAGGSGAAPDGSCQEPSCVPPQLPLTPYLKEARPVAARPIAVSTTGYVELAALLAGDAVVADDR